MRFLKTVFLTIIIVLYGLLVKAQSIHITGKVIDEATSKPLPNANIYIVNSTIGTHTNNTGSFAFANIPSGNYQLVISCLGYQTRQVEVPGISGEQVVSISLNTKAIELNAVNIRVKNDWKKNLALFTREFIGTDDTSECKILNGDKVLDIDFSNNKLTASTDNFLDIQNNMLGYKVRFLIKEFSADYNTGKTRYSGNAIFEELKGNDKQQKQWAKNRLEVYTRSFRSFLISLSRGQTKKDNYIIKKLTRIPNPRWKQDSITQEQNKIAENQPLKPGTQIVHTTYFMPPKVLESLEKTQLSEKDIMKPSGQSGIYQLQFQGYIYVINKNKRVARDIDDLYRPAEAGSYQTAAISILNPPVLFNSNGILLTKKNVFFEGAWNDRIIASMPTDYVPKRK